MVMIEDWNLGKGVGSGLAAFIVEIWFACLECLGCMQAKSSGIVILLILIYYRILFMNADARHRIILTSHPSISSNA